MSEALWTSDFILDGRTVQVKKTGARVVLDRKLAAEAARWFGFYLLVRARQALVRLARPGPAVWFAPEAPRPWYLVWAAAAWGGLRIERSPQAGAAAFYFDDVTAGEAPAGSGRVLNGACRDVSKSRVAQVFEEVFGYPLAIDPTRAQGFIVEKGEANGVHDGRVLWGPVPRRPGKAYQRLVENVEDGEAVDLRTPFVGHRPVVVFVKRRPVAERFANHNASVSLARPEAVFSPLEIARLSEFAAAMGLDWGGLDILRDRPSGRLYVVDVNKTDMGPPTALPLADKIRAVRRLARALRTLIQPEDAR